MHTLSKTAAATLKQLIEAARTSDRPGYLKLSRNESFMPVTIERVGEEGAYELWSVAHYYTQNGDAMRDPEIVFAVPVFQAGRPVYEYAFPVEWTQDGAIGAYGYSRIVEFDGGKPARFMPRFQRDTASFCTTWMRNIKAQQKLATLDAEPAIA